MTIQKSHLVSISRYSTQLATCLHSINDQLINYAKLHSLLLFKQALLAEYLQNFYLALNSSSRQLSESLKMGTPLSTKILTAAFFRYVEFILHRFYRDSFICICFLTYLHAFQWAHLAFISIVVLFTRLQSSMLRHEESICR